MRRSSTTIMILACAALFAGAANAKSAASADSTMILEGGEEGTVFKSLTVTGNDLVHVEFERPELRLDLDPRQAPGLEWGDANEMLAESGVDVVKPFVSLSANDPCPFLAKPWLNAYRSGPVARFQPKTEGVEHWWLTIADPRSDTLAVMEGKGKPPKEITWDGRSRNGSAVPPGVTCSYVLEALDRAGNRRSFVGQGFVLPAYRIHDAENETLLFSGEELGDPAALSSKSTVPAILLETASWLNQINPSSGPIQVKASARSFEEADRLSKSIASELQRLVLGDPARIQLVSLLLAEPELGRCTRDLAPALGLSEPTVSHHLRQLLDVGVVTKERRGMSVYYRPCPESVRAIARVLDITCC